MLASRAMKLASQSAFARPSPRLFRKTMRSTSWQTMYSVSPSLKAVSCACVAMVLLFGAHVVAASNGPRFAPDGAGTKANTPTDTAAVQSHAAMRTPAVELLLQVPQTFDRWAIRVVNNDVEPVRIVADARKLALLVRGPTDSKYHRCELPASMRGSDTDRMLVLAPGQSYRETFDPRLYCWGQVSNKLTHGASVTAFWGWPENTKLAKRSKSQEPPFALEPVRPPASFLPQKQMVSATQWLPENDVVMADPKVQTPAPKVLGAPDLRLSVPRWSDAINERDAMISATITNEGDRDALLHVRPDNLKLRVRRPDGTDGYCEPGSKYRASVRDFFTTIKPGRNKTISTLFSAICAPDVLIGPGLYQVYVTLRLEDSGKAFNLQAITGKFVAPSATLLRVRQTRQSHSAPMPEPEKPAKPSDSASAGNR